MMTSHGVVFAEVSGGNAHGFLSVDLIFVGINTTSSEILIF
jgi:hypothetical protein